MPRKRASSNRRSGNYAPCPGDTGSPAFAGDDSLGTLAAPLQPLMAAVAHRAAAGALAGAEPSLLRLLSLPLDRRERRALVRAVAERLRLRAPAGAPPIALAGLDIDRQRRAAADFRLCAHAHVHAPPASVASHASPQALASSRTRRM